MPRKISGPASAPTTFLSAPVTLTATVSGGGDGNAANNTASDVTTITGGPDLTLTKTDNVTGATTLLGGSGGDGGSGRLAGGGTHPWHGARAAGRDGGGGGAPTVYLKILISEVLIIEGLNAGEQVVKQNSLMLSREFKSAREALEGKPSPGRTAP